MVNLYGFTELALNRIARYIKQQNKNITSNDHDIIPGKQLDNCNVSCKAFIGLNYGMTVFQQFSPKVTYGNP